MAAPTCGAPRSAHPVAQPGAAGLGGQAPLHSTPAYACMCPPLDTSQECSWCLGHPDLSTCNTWRPPWLRHEVHGQHCAPARHASDPDPSPLSAPPAAAGAARWRRRRSPRSCCATWCAAPRRTWARPWTARSSLCPRTLTARSARPPRRLAAWPAWPACSCCRARARRARRPRDAQGGRTPNPGAPGGWPACKGGLRRRQVFLPTPRGGRACAAQSCAARAGIGQGQGVTGSRAAPHARPARGCRAGGGRAGVRPGPHGRRGAHPGVRSGRRHVRLQPGRGVRGLPGGAALAPAQRVLHIGRARPSAARPQASAGVLQAATARLMLCCSRLGVRHACILRPP